MSQKVESIAKNVQGETTNMKNQFSNLEHSLKELSQGGLFGQIDGMIQELKRLNEINGKYEMRYFLLCVELERRSKIISEYLVQIQSFEETIRRKDYEFSKEIERIREEEVVKTRRILESEIVNLKNQSSAERARLERRVQELQIELANRDSEIEEFKKRLFAKDDIISRLKSENQELSFKNSDMAKYYETEITRIRSEHQQILIEIETRYKNEIEMTRRLGEDERNKEVEKQKKSISDYYSQQIGQRENELSRLTNIVETTRIRITELERENGGIHMQLDSRTKEVSELRDQLSSSKRNHEEYILRITETHRMTIQKAISERDKEMKDKLELELSRIEKELKEKKNIILGLEQRILYMEKENERGGLRLNDILIERDELKSRLIDVEKQLGEELRMLEENYSVQMEEREGQLRVLEVQNRELHELYVRAEEQERSRTGGLVQENEMLKREMQKLRELGEMRNREIEEWKVKYKSYVTAEDMREELTRLRRTNMECEEETARSRSELGRTNERVRGMMSELEMKDQELQNLGELAGRRRQELLNVQAENDKLRGMLRALNESKDNTESQKLIFNEAYLNMERDLSQLRNERDRYKQDWERSQQSLGLTTKKLTDTIMQMEELNTSSKVTTSVIKSSGMYSSKTIDPNYRGEAFGK